MVTLKFCKESAVASSGFGSLPKRAKCDAGGCGHTHTHTLKHTYTKCRQSRSLFARKLCRHILYCQHFLLMRCCSCSIATAKDMSCDSGDSESHCRRTKINKCHLYCLHAIIFTKALQKPQ